MTKRAAQERTTWPAGHVVSMTRDGPPERAFSVATCECGWRSRVEAHNWQNQDAAIERHWRQVEALP